MFLVGVPNPVGQCVASYGAERGRCENRNRRELAHPDQRACAYDNDGRRYEKTKDENRFAGRDEKDNDEGRMRVVADIRDNRLKELEHGAYRSFNPTNGKREVTQRPGLLSSSDNVA